MKRSHAPLASGSAINLPKREFHRTQRIALAVVPRLTALLIRIFGATLRYEDVFPPEAVSPLPGDQIPGPTIYACWHCSLLVCAHRFRDRNIAILISRSFDGELIARTVERLGFRALRGSSSRSGATGLRQMAQAYAEGHICAFTADGPRGPARIAKPGPAQLAELTGAAWIGAFHAQPLRSWRLSSWDGFLIPKPFSKVAVSFASQVPTETPQLQTAIQHSLDQAVELATSHLKLHGA